MKLKIREVTVFAIMGALMFASKELMAALPNIHLVGVFTVALTVAYRGKALYPIYIFAFLEGLYGGFSPWWIPYLYIWTVLWAVTMLLPKNMPAKVKTPVYMVVCGLHGLLYGVLYAPAYALISGMNFKAMLAWIAAGFSFDLLHAAGNFTLGILVVPIVTVLKKADGR